MLKDCLFCFAVPVLQIALHYVIQINRYTVMTIYGCVDATDLSWPSIVIVQIWSPIFACLNVYFASTSSSRPFPIFLVQECLVSVYLLTNPQS